MVNLKASPFFLNEEQLNWVEETIDTMTLEEKIGQLFINFTVNRNPEYIKDVCQKYHVGGIRGRAGHWKKCMSRTACFRKQAGSRF